MMSDACTPLPVAPANVAAFDPLALPERFSPHGEPRLAELLDDPILKHLLASDGVQMDGFRRWLAETQARLIAD